ncbi:hypothetical protein EON64_09195 [archaeon]|nr:MAG: hypothetical protein EON64_09195 [archaeon]
MKIKSAGPAGTVSRVATFIRSPLNFNYVSSCVILQVVTTTTQYDDKEGKLSPKLGLKWSHTSGFTVEKLESAADGKLTVETSLVNVAPGLKVEFKGKDTDKADVLVTYTAPVATVTAEVDVSNFSSAKTSVTAGSGPFTAGASADLKLAKSNVDSASFGLGVAYSIPKQLLVTARADKNLSAYSALFSYAANKDIKVAGRVDYAGKDPKVELVSTYDCNPCTTVKVKATSGGVFSAAVKQALDKKFNVTGSAEFSNNFSNVRLGLNATLG